MELPSVQLEVNVHAHHQSNELTLLILTMLLFIFSKLDGDVIADEYERSPVLYSTKLL